MKKTTGVLAVIALAAGAYSGAAWYFGKQAQQVIQAAVATTNQRLATTLGTGPNDLAVRLRVDRYERGVFSSSADYILEINDGEGSALELRLQDALSHGPFPWEGVRNGSFEPLLALSRARVVETPSTRAWVQSQQLGESPLLIETRVGFGGSGRSLWQFKPVTITKSDGVFSFSGGTVSVGFSNNASNSNVSGKFDSLALSGREPGENLGISGISITADTTTQAQGKVVSSSVVAIQRLVTDDPSFEDEIVIGDTKIAVSGEQDGNFIKGDVRYDFGSIQVGSINLGAMALGAGIDRFNLAELTALAADYDAIVAKQGHPDDLTQLDPADQKRLNNRVLAVLASKPVIRIDPVLWKNDKGQSTASLQVDLQQPVASDATSIDTLLIRAVGQAKLDVSLSRAMVLRAAVQLQDNPEDAQQVEEFFGAMYDQYIAELQQAGLVSVDDDTARVSIAYRDEQVQLNGRPMPLDEFMGLMFGLLLVL